MDISIDKIIDISKQAGQAILDIYATDFEVDYKEDESPLTAADQAANDIIVKALAALYPDIPIISEEIKNMDYEERKSWELCWVVDPLDGTKEFLKRNGEFTVNIALVKNGEPILGVIYVPVKDVTYYNAIGGKAYKQLGTDSANEISAQAADGANIKIVASRSHLNEDTEKFIEEKKKEFSDIDIVAAGSSLKFCLVAEGTAHVYPRFAPTMEWDTAAGQAIVVASGARVLRHPEMTPLDYNKENLLNPYFLVTAQ